MLVRTEVNRKVMMPVNTLAAFNMYALSDAQNAKAFRNKYLSYRDLGRCPRRATDTLCMQTACAFRQVLERETPKRFEKERPASAAPLREWYG